MCVTCVCSIVSCEPRRDRERLGADVAPVRIVGFLAVGALVRQEGTFGREGLAADGAQVVLLLAAAGGSCRGCFDRRRGKARKVGAAHQPLHGQPRLVERLDRCHRQGHLVVVAHHFWYSWPQVFWNQKKHNAIV